jgi:hypothetical protein
MGAFDERHFCVALEVAVKNAEVQKFSPVLLHRK